MEPVFEHFAGAERSFCLGVGEFIDIEEASGHAIGVVYQRFATTTYSIKDVLAVLTEGLIGGGMKPQDANRLVKGQLCAKPLIQSGALAGGILMYFMTGVDPDENSEPGDPTKRLDKGRIFHSFLQIGMSPEQVRAMRWSDFVELIRASGGEKVQAPTEEEFEAMLSAWEEMQAE